jgi:hypothetical protein
MFKQIKLKSTLSLAAFLVVGGIAYQGLPYQIFAKQEASEVYASTEDYLHRFDPDKYKHAGTDFFNPRYSPDRLGKPRDQIDITYDYPFDYLDQVEQKLKHVDRRQALKGIFEKITVGTSSDHERHLAVLDFLYRAAHHNPFVQPVYADKQAVFDPLVLLELGEMRCGAVARVAADLFDAAGYKTRLVQAHAHTTAEIFYDGKWSLFEADLAGGPPLLINGRIPSVAELAKNPFLIDRVPTHFEGYIAPKREFNKSEESPKYPSYFFFSYAPLKKIEATYYYKTASPEEAANSKWYGWNYYKTTTDRWKLTEFEPKYEPDPSAFKNIKRHGGKFTIEWWPARDSDNDLIGYRVYVSTKSRGWNYQDIEAPQSVKKYFTGGWKPEMYDNLFKEPPKDVAFFETESTSVELPFSNTDKPIFVTIMPFDKHGESVGRRLYNMSVELKLTN